MIESRKHPRSHSQLRCWCEGGEVTVYARIRNLSEGGLFLGTSTPLREGTQATVRFGESDREVSAAVTVVWTHEGGREVPKGMGLRFETLDEKSLERLRQIIMGQRQLAQFAV